jgi:hypothetical protein
MAKKEGGTKVGNFLRNTFGRQSETTTSTELTSTTITGSKDNEGIITGDRTKDVVTPSKEIPDRRGGGGGGSVYIPLDEVIGKTPPQDGGGGSTPITLTKSGSTKIGNKTYTGNAYISELGMTANQYNQSVQNEINKERKEKGLKAIGKGRYTARGELVSEEQLTQQSTQGLFGGGLASGVFGNIPERNYGTAVDEDKFKMEGIDLLAPSTIYAMQTGTTKSGSPIFTTRTIDENWESRPSTKEEIDILFPSVVRPSTPEEIKALKRSNTIFGEIGGEIKQISKGEFGAGVYAENKLTNWMTKESDSSIFKPNTKKVLGGIAIGIIPETKGKVVKDIATFGVGSAIGAGVKGGSLLLSSVKGAKYTLPLFKGGTYGAGAILTGAYIGGTAQRVYEDQDYSRKGEILGSSTKEFALLGTGFSLGSKGAEIGYGLWRTRGRTELPLSNLVRESVISGKESFPTAPPSTHLNLLKGTIKSVPELAEGKAGGFHVTPEQFFGKNKDITPQAGTAELAGLYVGSEASIYFGKVGGGGYSLFNLPTLKSLSSAEKPAIAFLKPTGFREVGFRKVNPYKVGDQTFKYEFNKPSREGYIDIPQMKTEIEGIARPDAGSYGFESGKYFTTINNVRVPIDVFGFKGKTNLLLEGAGKKGGRGKSLSSESYGYLPEKYSLIDLRGSIYSGRSSKKISSKLPSYFSSSSYKPNYKSYMGRSSNNILSYNYNPRSKSSTRSQTSYNALSPSGYSSSYSSSSRLSIPPSYLPKRTNYKQKGKSSLKLSSREGYQPSFTSSALGIYATKAEVKRLKKTGLLGGFALRPIIR